MSLYYEMCGPANFFFLFLEGGGGVYLSTDHCMVLLQPVSLKVFILTHDHISFENLKDIKYLTPSSLFIAL